MATKADVKKLISKGLTGKEAARLILEDSWEVDHQREGFLSKADIQRIKRGLSGQEAQEYNKWIHLYQLVDYTLKDAHIMALEAQNTLLLAVQELSIYDLEDRARHILMASPAIVTEKQLQELKAKQREQKLRAYYELAYVLAEFSLSLAPPEILEEMSRLEDEEWEGGLAYENGYLLREHYPQYWQQAKQKLMEDVQAGRLQPVQLLQEDILRLEALEKEIQALREKRWPSDEDIRPPASWNDRDEQRWDRLTEKKHRHLKVAQERARPLEAEELEELLAREDEDVLDWNYISGKELYEMGFYEVWIDVYEPNLDEETAARPAGMMQSGKLAIIQEPDGADLDERGWYVDRAAERLSKLSGYFLKEARAEKKGFSGPEFLEMAHGVASEKIKSFLAIQAVVEAISSLIGVQMTEDLDKWYEFLQVHVDIYNNYLTRPEGSMIGPPYYLGMPRLEALKIGRLKATARSLRYYKERMAIALGDDWAKEAIQSLEFEPGEPESLAEAMRKDIQGLRGTVEAEDGQE